MTKSANEEKFNELRAVAQVCSMKHNLYTQLSQQAFKRGDKEIAKDLSKEAKKFKTLADKENQVAADKLFAYHNAGKAADEIDLHGLYVQEAIDRLTRRVNDSKSSGQNILVIIVGRGLHSQGTPKIKPAVIKFAIKHKIQHEVDSPHVGCIKFQFETVNTSMRAKKKHSKRKQRQSTVIQIHESDNDEVEHNHSGKKNKAVVLVILALSRLRDSGWKFFPLIVEDTRLILSHGTIASSYSKKLSILFKEFF